MCRAPSQMHFLLIIVLLSISNGEINVYDEQKEVDDILLESNTDSTHDFTDSSTQPTITSCGCMKAPGSDVCFPYDPRLQATSVEEAFLNFPDLSVPDSIEEQTFDPTLLTTGAVCSTEECITCSEDLADHMLKKGLLSNTTKNRVMGKIHPKGKKKQSKENRRKCKKYKFNQEIEPTLEGDITLTTDCLRTLPVDLKPKHGRHKPKPNKPRKGQKGKKGGRFRRQTELGTVWTISCSERGEPEREGSQSTVVLCNMCWTWRQLPPDYFPQYINELKCDSNVRCLSGYGSCEQRWKYVNVLRNMNYGVNGASPSWQQATIKANACCDCKINYGSTLHAFATA